MIDLKQQSTQKGLVLVGAGIAAATGHPELFSVGISNGELSIAGAIGSLVSTALGIFEILRNEKKAR